jgi:hypothetical protein
MHVDVLDRDLLLAFPAIPILQRLKREECNGGTCVVLSWTRVAILGEWYPGQR